MVSQLSDLYLCNLSMPSMFSGRPFPRRVRARASRHDSGVLRLTHNHHCNHFCVSTLASCLICNKERQENAPEKKQKRTTERTIIPLKPEPSTDLSTLLPLQALWISERRTHRRRHIQEMENYGTRTEQSFLERVLWASRSTSVFW